MILYYLKNIKLIGFDKSIHSIFFKLCFLLKHLKAVITLKRNIYNSKAIFIVFNSIYNNFNLIIIEFN